MAQETITLKLIAQDLASGNISRAIGAIDKLAQRGGIAGSIFQGIGIQFGMMLNPVMLMSRAFGAVTDVMGDSVNAAANLEESQSKVGQVFKETADDVLAWADDLDSAFGITEQAALESVGTMGNFVKALGGTEDEARKVGIAMTELAGDLGSFNNVATDEVLVALRSGLAGETEPMRRLGVDIADVRVQALLLSEGVQKVNGQFAQSDKVMARYKLIMQQTTDAQGDAARTVDTLRGQQRRMAAEMGNSLATIGEALIPVATGFTSLAATVIPEAVQQAANLAGVVSGLADDLNAMVTQEVRASTEAELIANQFGITTEQLLAMTNQLRDNDRAMESLNARTQLNAQYGEDAFKSWADYEAAQALAYAGIEQTTEATEEQSEAVLELIRAAEMQAKVDTERSRYFSRMAGGIVEVTEATGDFNKSMAGTAAGVGVAIGGVQGLSSALRTLDANLDEFTDVRPLGKVNDEIRKTKKAMNEAAEEGRAAAWARNRAHLAELKSEREVTLAAKEALNEWKNQKKGIDDVTASAEELGKTDPKVTITANTANVLSRLDALQAKLSTIGSTQTYIDIVARGGRAGSGGGGGPVTTKRAAGGPVEAGRTYLVGERGPELLHTNSSSGYITPNHKIGGTTVVIQGGTYLGSPEDARRWAAWVVPAIERERRRAGVA